MQTEDFLQNVITICVNYIYGHPEDYRLGTSRYLSGLLPCVRRHITVNIMC